MKRRRYASKAYAQSFSFRQVKHIFRSQSRHFLDVKATVRHVGGHLLQLKLLGELLVELLKFSDELATGLDNGGLGSDLAVGVDAELKSGEEGVRDFVGGEGDVLHAEQLVAQHVGEGVVLLVECEESGVRDLCRGTLAVCLRSSLGRRIDLRVTVSISILRSPSARRNSSCLSGMSKAGLIFVVHK